MRRDYNIVGQRVWKREVINWGDECNQCNSVDVFVDLFVNIGARNEKSQYPKAIFFGGGGKLITKRKEISVSIDGIRKSIFSRLCVELERTFTRNI